MIAEEVAAVNGFDQLGPVGVRHVVNRWLRQVTADGELASCLVGVDLVRLAGHLALLLTVVLGGPAGDIVRPSAGVWRGLGLDERQHRRAVNYLAGTLRTMGLPTAVVERVGRVCADEADGIPPSRYPG